MPFNHPCSPSLRGQRRTERESRRRTISESRHISKKHSKASEEGTDAQSLPPTSPVLYSQHNVALDRLSSSMSDIKQTTPMSNPQTYTQSNRNDPSAAPDTSKNKTTPYQPTVEDDAAEDTLRRVRSTPRPIIEQRHTPARLHSPGSSHRRTQTVDAPDIVPKSALPVEVINPGTTPAKITEPNHPATRATHTQGSNTSSGVHSETPVEPTDVLSGQPTSSSTAISTTRDQPSPTSSARTSIAWPSSTEQPHQDSQPSSPRTQALQGQTVYARTNSPSSYDPYVGPYGFMAHSSGQRTPQPYSPSLAQAHPSAIEQVQMAYGYHPYQPVMPMGHQAPVYPAPYHVVPMSPPMDPANQQSQSVEGSVTKSTNEEDPNQLLAKVSNVLPDLSRLLHNYQQTHTQLTSKEQQSRETEKELSASLQKKDFELDALRRNFTRTLDAQAIECRDLRAKCTELEKIDAECKGLRLEVGHLRESCKDLNKTLDELQATRESLLQANASLEKENHTLRKTLAEAQDKHARDIQNMKTKAVEEMDAVKQSHSEAFNDKQSAFVTIQGQMADLIQKHSKDMERVKQESRRDLDDQKTKLDLKQRELNGTMEKHRHEIEILQRAREQDRMSIDAEMNEQLRKFAETQRQKELDFQRKSDSVTQELKARQDENQRLLSEKGLVERNRDEAKSKYQDLFANMSSMQNALDNLSHEKKKFDKTLQSLGHATEMKSKGDAFYVESFQQLAIQIKDISSTFVGQHSMDPPSEVTAKIPPNLPNMLGNTEAARRLRGAYVQHLIWNILTYRIFEPFLFTLGHRFDNADSFLQELSGDIREKSIRREAVWRQTTLRAAYTVSEAKQTINAIAALIADDIFNEIQHFTDPKMRTSLIVEVRRIVKLAAEVWRYARVEREVITVTIPTSDGETGQKWPDCSDEDELQTTHVSRGSQGGNVLLGIVPRIVRDVVHEDFLLDNEQQEQTPCIYLEGMALYPTSPAVVARQGELDDRSSEQGAMVGDRQGCATPSANNSEKVDLLVESQPDELRREEQIAAAKGSEYLREKDTESASKDKIAELDDVPLSRTSPYATVEKGAAFDEKTQSQAGLHWERDSTGPLRKVTSSTTSSSPRTEREGIPDWSQAKGEAWDRAE